MSEHAMDDGGKPSDDLSSRYDQTPYISAAFAPSKPDNLSVIGALAGLPPPPVDRCRVLEIGCASGGNLLPLAQSLPGSQFIGIDLSARQIEQGRQLSAQAGLRNVELRCQDILGFGDDEPFDYIIAHGFYSWVPAEVREHVMRLCRRLLSPSGLAYFSYNALPGWHAKRMSRDMMLFHARSAAGSQERIARAREIMAIAAANPPAAETPYSAAIRQLASGIASCPDWLLEHDELELFNEPVYFEDFVEHAKSHQLRYLGGAQPQMNLLQQLPPPLREKLRGFTSDPVALEQYADFIWGTQYRDAVLCREEAVGTAKTGAAAVQQMYVAGWLVEQSMPSPQPRNGAVRFVNPLQKREVVVSDDRWIAALRYLGRSWPSAVSFADLLGAAAEGKAAAANGPLGDFLSAQLLSAHHANMLELWTRPTDFIAPSPSRPRLTPLARLQGEAGNPITNLRHEECRFVDPFIKRFIGLLDGSRDRAALLEFLLQGGSKGSPAGSAVKAAQSTTRANELLDNILLTLSKRSLFIAE
jgi:SAM-dependent methyltransferase